MSASPTAEQIATITYYNNMFANMGEETFLRRIDEWKMLPEPMLRATAAVHWCKLTYPDDSPLDHRVEATEIFDAPTN